MCVADQTYEVVPCCASADGGYGLSPSDIDIRYRSIRYQPKNRYQRYKRSNKTSPLFWFMCCVWQLKSRGYDLCGTFRSITPPKGFYCTIWDCCDIRSNLHYWQYLAAVVSLQPNNTAVNTCDSCWAFVYTQWPLLQKNSWVSVTVQQPGEYISTYGPWSSPSRCLLLLAWGTEICFLGAAHWTNRGWSHKQRYHTVQVLL